MNNITEITRQIKSGIADAALLELYTEDGIDRHKKRYLKLLAEHLRLFGDAQAMMVSSPGRTELGGNHTDHNLGTVLAGSVDLDSVCVVSSSGSSGITFVSEGYEPVRFNIDELDYRAEEKDTTKALLRGISSRFTELGYTIGGFNLNMNSDVLKGSGLSSSASVEVLVGTVLSELFNNGMVTPVEVAQIGQYAENNYFGKASGLMDQLACAAGGIIGIDFRDPEEPEIFPVSYEFRKHGYTLIVTDARSSHANLSDEYSAMPAEMRRVAAEFGKTVCREISFEEFLPKVAELRVSCGDRAVLRAFHFLRENARAVEMREALEADDFTLYLNLVNDSGNSSFKYLQNIYLGNNPSDQALSIALAFSEDFLSGRGAARVQGGGFAGTIQAYVPTARVDSYVELMESIFGSGCSAELKIRLKPACRIL
ncbi:MAG: galactokinase [Spirochaetales bacterium]|nr:galactokinase [Spirochaetales bacterium]